MRLLCILIAALSGGCGNLPLLGPIGAHPDSLIRRDELTEFRWLTADQLSHAPSDVIESDWQSLLASEIPESFSKSQQKLLPELAAVAAPIAIAFAANQVVTRLYREAGLYQSQFTARSKFVNTFDGPRPRLLGFEIIRTAGQFDESKPAFRLIGACKPSQECPGLFEIAPLLIQTRATRAKLLLPGSSVNTRIDLAIDTVQLDSRQTLTKKTVATLSYSLDHQNIPQPHSRLLHGQSLGSVVLPTGSAVSFMAIVTERDANCTGESFIDLSKIISDHVDSLSAATTQPARR